MQRLGGRCSREDVKLALNNLSNEGKMYTTLDEDQYQWCGRGRFSCWYVNEIYTSRIDVMDGEVRISLEELPIHEREIRYLHRIQDYGCN